MTLFPGFKTTLLAASVLLAYTGLAQAQNVTLNDVTVFIRGAELFNSSKVTLPAGESEVVFTNIACGLNEQHVRPLLEWSDSDLITDIISDANAGFSPVGCD